MGHPGPKAWFQPGKRLHLKSLTGLAPTDCEPAAIFGRDPYWPCGGAETTAAVPRKSALTQSPHKVVLNLDRQSPGKTGRILGLHERKRTLRRMTKVVAEGAGFEPAIPFPVYTLSRRAPSTTRPPLRIPLVRAGCPASAAGKRGHYTIEAAQARRGPRLDRAR
jgi:hypothetical protein